MLIQWVCVKCSISALYGYPDSLAAYPENCFIRKLYRHINGLDMFLGVRTRIRVFYTITRPAAP